MGLKLDLGCGNNKIGGYVGVDCSSEFKPDIVCDLTKDCPAPSNSVEAVHCSHFLEHMTNEERDVFLKNVIKMCQVGAKVTIIVPLFLPDPSHKVILTYDWIHYLRPMLIPWLALYEYRIESITTNSILPGENGREFTYEQATAVYIMKTREGLDNE